MPKILFDIIHLAHLNFYKNAILYFKRKGYDIEITYLDRGKIEQVLKKELPGFNIKKVGKYQPGVIGKIPMILSRLAIFCCFLRKSKPDITTGVGDFILAFSSRLRRKPSIQFYDDFEFKINFNLSRFFGNKLVIPACIPAKKSKIIKYNGFKELAYLHPKVYSPKKRVVEKIGLKENEYVFVREVSNISLNYLDLEKESLVEPIKYLHEKGIKVVLSLEDKSRRKYYEECCEILEEPLEDIYSIMRYARFALSSGDSVARECALIGTQCIYSGGRDMYVNTPFIDLGGIFKIQDNNKIITKIKQLMNIKEKDNWSKKISKLIKKWKSTTDVIIDVLEKNLNK